MTLTLNKRLYMVVRLLDEPEMIFDMRTYEPVFAPDVEEVLNKHIDFAAWGKEFEYYDTLWLDWDDESIYNLQHPVNQRILYAIRQTNTELPEDTHLFYYYDIDRTDERGPEWTHCPLTGKPLVNLGNEIAHHGRFVSFDSYLAVPDIVDSPVYKRLRPA